MPGGTGDEQKASEEIQALCSPLKDQALEKAQAGGWNGLFTEFTAMSYTSQVVAGTNYFVKVKVGDNKFCHVRVHQPLPHTGQPPAVHSLQLDKAEGDAIEYF
mmetsp:Transcript_119734/g.168529  ORF Transcript_119734/g.168529 Transcript_119734/m.168529 type:complete len:103 (-) Transcript_119734:114-422(-)